MKKIILVAISISFLLNHVKGQQATPEVLASAGDYFTSSVCNMSWTSGEISIETYTSATSILTQGFHQPDIYFLSIKEKVQSAKNILIYPNPATDYFSIDLSGIENKDVMIDLVDLSGKTTTISSLLSGIPSLNINNSFQYNISSLTSGTYMLHIYSKDGSINMIYKLIKF